MPSRSHRSSPKRGSHTPHYKKLHEAAKTGSGTVTGTGTARTGATKRGSG